MKVGVVAVPSRCALATLQAMTCSCVWIRGQVLCTDRNKIKMAEVAVNKFCEFMRMPKAINQSSLSQVMDSPIGCSSAQSIPNGCDPIPDDEKECAYFSQLP